MERPAAKVSATAAPAEDTAMSSFDVAREAARDAVLKLASQPGGVKLAQARQLASDSPHATARAIVRLLSSGCLKLTQDRRLVPGPRQ